MSLTNIFSQYVGKEVKMIGNEVKPDPYWDKGDYMAAPQPALDVPDQTLSDMMKTAHDNGLNLVLSIGPQHYYQDFQLNRVTAYVNQEDDGKWRVQDKFDLG